MGQYIANNTLTANLLKIYLGKFYQTIIEPLSHEMYFCITHGNFVPLPLKSILSINLTIVPARYSK